ncbi:unnamed protein product, partial [Staurois parvus]
MSCQSAPVLQLTDPQMWRLHSFSFLGFLSSSFISYFFIGFFEFGQGHRGPMIPYCPGAP